MPVMPATWEVETGGSWFKAILGKVNGRSYLKNRLIKTEGLSYSKKKLKR
jgi:hypothetical protein